MAEKSIVMSISVKPDTQDLLKAAAKKADLSVSELVRLLVQRHLPLIVNDGSEIPVVLKIPSNLRGNAEELRAWLTPRLEKVINSLSAPKSS